MVNIDSINNRRELIRLSGITLIEDVEIKEMQKYYDDGHSLRECQVKYGHCRATLIKYLTTRSRTKLHMEQKRQKNINGVISWRQRTKKRLVEYKGGKCCICGYNKCIRNLHFHHKDPSKKEFGITAQTKSFVRLKAETDKCILVCSNCHGEIHDGMITIWWDKLDIC